MSIAILFLVERIDLQAQPPTITLNAAVPGQVVVPGGNDRITLQVRNSGFLAGLGDDAEGRVLVFELDAASLRGPKVA